MLSLMWGKNMHFLSLHRWITLVTNKWTNFAYFLSDILDISCTLSRVCLTHKWLTYYRDLLPDRTPIEKGLKTYKQQKNVLQWNWLNCTNITHSTMSYTSQKTYVSHMQTFLLLPKKGIICIILKQISEKGVQAKGFYAASDS